MSDYKRKINLNLNLLPMLDALLDCRNVTRAGERLNLTQPAASGALAKLRVAFSDELLVAVGRDMKLTPKAERMREPVRQLIELLGTAFDSEDPDLDPASWTGEFSMATTDAVAILVLPELIEKTDATTPGLSLRVTNMTRSSVSNLRGEEIDMIIAPPQIVGDESLMSRRLFGDRLVVVHSADHPPTDESLAEYMKRGHVTTVIDAPRISGPPHSFFNADIDMLRSTQRNLAILPYYSLLPLLVAGTSRLALVQERLAKRFMKSLPIAYVDLPIPNPPLDMHMFWSPKFNEDPRHVWMRNTIFESCAQYR